MWFYNRRGGDCKYSSGKCDTGKNSMVKNAGVENAGADSRGGKCRSIEASRMNSRTDIIH